MGVHGLWRLIEPSGKPVPFETLENKVLAVDISLWLHQSVKGFQDSRGAPLPNAHLLGIYHRLCKLLFFRIKPVFVFDGGVPELKRQTIAKRKHLKARNANRADEIQRELLHKILKHTAVSKVLEDKLQLPEKPIVQRKTSAKEDMFALDAKSSLDFDSTLSSSEEDTSFTDGDSSSPSKYADLHNVDLESQNFKSLPVDVRHEILTDLKETRKQSSWGKIHEIPKISHEFSSYQMQRLLKRQAVQSALEQAEKEMGGKTLSLAELETMLKDQGIITDDSLGKKIASDEHAKYLLVKANQKESELKKLQPIAEESEDCESSNASEVQSKSSETEPQVVDVNKTTTNLKENIADQEYENDLQKAIALSLMEEPLTSKESFKDNKDESSSSFIENFTDADFMSSSSEEDVENISRIVAKKKTMASAEHYMVEYSGLTPSEIAKILDSKTPKSKAKFAKHKSKEFIENIECDDQSTQNIKEAVIPESSVNKDEHLDKVEVMSTSSEDSTDLVEVCSTVVNVVVNPNETFDDKNDLFSDIFESKVKDKKLEINDDSNVKCVSSRPFDFKDDKKKEEFEIKINLEEKPEDDLFSDIFGENQSEENQNVSSSDGDHTQPVLDTLFVEDTDVSMEKNKEKGNVSSTCSVKNLDNNLTLSEVDSKEINLEQKILSNAESSENVPKEISKATTADLSIDIEIIDNLKKANKTGSLSKQLTELKNKLQQETNDLIGEKGVKQRMAENITDQMYQEAQDLLELFGVPYIIAPMEAEAQCAFLDEIELTNGTITDDSDIWLFGGRTVYKNFFNQNKYVMEFRAENIEHHFKLSREQMILLALLVGSDYTNGLQGVGPVTAMEILATFPPSKLKETDLRQLVSGLMEFRSWFTKGKSAGIGRTSLKKKLKNITFTDNFPSVQVVQAYLEPKVETSDELFSWGKPNFEALIEFARDKFAWTRLKAEQILNPVLQRLQESRVQKSIKDYFAMQFKVTDSGQVLNQMSKRVKSAIKNMGKDPNQRIADEFAEEIAKELRKKPTKRKTNAKEGNNEVKPKGSRQKKAVQDENSEVSSTSQENHPNETNVQKQLEETENVKKRHENEDNLENSKQKPKKMTRTNTKSNKKSKNNQNPDSCTDVKDKSKSKVKRLTKKVIPENDLQNNSNISKQESENESSNSEDEITNKIALIRQRRERNQLKKQLELQTKKLDKSKKKENENKVIQIPEELKEDEDVDALVQAALVSGSKVEQIYRNAQEELDNLSQASTSRVASSSASSKVTSSTASSRPNLKQLKPSIPKRTARIPQKESIPQKKQDQAMMLRNKMKAIEVFRKSKKGPGFVPKSEKRKIHPKDDAALSESSSD